MAKDKHIQHLVLHLLTAFVLLLKGYDKFTHHPFIGSLIFGFGLIIVFYVVYVLLFKKESSRLSIFVHFFEAVALLFTSYIFFADGKQYLPYIILAASIGFFISVYVSLKKQQKNLTVKHAESLFSYGTLQSEEVQKKVFGRKLAGNSDILSGYMLRSIEIADENFLSNGEDKVQSTLIATGKDEDLVPGTIFRISKEELLYADRYEPGNYERIQVTLASGTVAWVYCARTADKD